MSHLPSNLNTLQVLCQLLLYQMSPSSHYSMKYMHKSGYLLETHKYQHRYSIKIIIRLLTTCVFGVTIVTPASRAESRRVPRNCLLGNDCNRSVYHRFPPPKNSIQTLLSKSHHLHSLETYTSLLYLLFPAKDASVSSFKFVWKRHVLLHCHKIRGMAHVTYRPQTI